MPTMPRQPPPARRPRAAGIRRPSPTPRPTQGAVVEDVVEQAAEEVVEQAAEDVVEDVVEEAVEQEAPPERKPSPRPKTRDDGVAKPVDYQAAEREVGQSWAAAPVYEPRRGPSRPANALNRIVSASVLLVFALAFVGLAVWFKSADNKLSAETANTALLDVARTSQVNQAATSAIETLFSYDYNDVAKTQNAAKDLLANDDVRNTYNSLMGEVQRLAPEQKMVVTVNVSRSAVMNLEGDRARVLVFVDQTATRTDQNQTSSGSAELWVNLRFSDGKWKVTGLDTYKPQPPATPPPPPSAPAPGK